MTDTTRSSGDRARTAGTFDSVVGLVALSLSITFLVMALLVGPCEAMERLAVVLRKVLPFWGR